MPLSKRARQCPSQGKSAATSSASCGPKRGTSSSWSTAEERWPKRRSPPPRNKCRPHCSKRKAPTSPLSPDPRPGDAAHEPPRVDHREGNRAQCDRVLAIPRDVKRKGHFKPLPGGTAQALRIAAMKQCGRLDLPASTSSLLSSRKGMEGTLLFGDTVGERPFLWDLPSAPPLKSPSSFLWDLKRGSTRRRGPTSSNPRGQRGAPPPQYPPRRDRSVGRSYYSSAIL